MSKKLIYIFALLFLTGTAAALIEINNEKDIYALGDKLKPSLKINLDTEGEVLLKLTIECGDYKLHYFTIPFIIEKNQEISLNVPSLTINKDMLGQCRLIAEIEGMDQELVIKKISGYFNIESKIDISAEPNKQKIKPGETLLIKGSIEISNEDYNNISIRIITDKEYNFIRNFYTAFN